MVTLQDLSTRLNADDPEERQIISGVSWDGYDIVLQEKGDRLSIDFLGISSLISPLSVYR
ncbi:MAG: hypothetical protein AAFR31_13380 [Cyanobacteria bacterium J06627_8]